MLTSTIPATSRHSQNTGERAKTLTGYFDPCYYGDIGRLCRVGYSSSIPSRAPTSFGEALV